ncbi:hypothetical protein CEE37_04660 [candidate division LCP-89 bacterium B3_LCP]|uniref:Antitoxin SocA-like Panacea domain-containing protein n=1 Tax=candidate division LCP-89 bacterium B3_LCP TaxID=2012998 RepID=A0A532V3R8_UNCL8|nr:MAG: hypothetical protein CEE37_04660 [candidate division LCP-89 bacterium B3_LCP]
MISKTSIRSSGPIENGLDIVLTLLYAPGGSGQKCEPVRGITRLQKLLFLLWKEGAFYEDIPNLYNFKAYDFGPCLDDIYDDLDFAEDIGLIYVSEVPSGNEYEGGDEDAFLEDFGFNLVKRSTRRDFELTEAGREAARDIYENLDTERCQRLEQIKRRFNFMPFFDLLRYVYRKYPVFAKKSVLSL